jgi:hypothetical protein
MALASLQPGVLSVASGELLDANINRSPTAYLANPASERARYQHDIDKEMTLLKIEDGTGRCVLCGSKSTAQACLIHRACNTSTCRGKGSATKRHS